MILKQLKVSLSQSKSKTQAVYLLSKTPSPQKPILKQPSNYSTELLKISWEWAIVFKTPNKILKYNNKSKSKNNKSKKTEINKLKTENDKLKDLVNKYEEMNNKLFDYVKNNKSIVNNTYHISVKNYVQQNYPNAPVLKGLNDYAKIKYDDQISVEIE